jgi:hypothetical protein
MIRVDVAPEIERRFADAAHARGLEAEAYASQLITSAVTLTEEKHPSEHELEDFFTRMAAYANKIPELPLEAYSRESIYRDHD